MDNVKNQLIEKLKGSNHVLITVQSNPNLDQLAASIALTLVLNKLNKNATTIFSGEIPSVIEFLNPDKTIEKNTDSLQDFIISLDKSKADKLRYKVEDNFVRIYITPYHTALSEKDLVFSHGEINVDLVVGLGIKDQSELDKAITAHGQILHDATVSTITVGEPSKLGSINWADSEVSSICELILQITEVLKPEGLLDSQIANALLTGIVSETDRFGNKRTSSITMTASSKLLEAGANPELVAKQLDGQEIKVPQEKHEPTPVPPKPAPKPTPEPAQPPPGELAKIKKVDDGALHVQHDEQEDKLSQVMIDEQGNVVSPEERKNLETPPPPVVPTIPSEQPKPPTIPEQPIPVTPASSLMSEPPKVPAIMPPHQEEPQGRMMQTEPVINGEGVVNETEPPSGEPSKSEPILNHGTGSNNLPDLNTIRDAVDAAITSGVSPNEIGLPEGQQPTPPMSPLPQLPPQPMPPTHAAGSDSMDNGAGPTPPPVPPPLFPPAQ